MHFFRLSLDSGSRMHYYLSEPKFAKHNAAYEAHEEAVKLTVP
jgi:hypothetical protein